VGIEEEYLLIGPDGVPTAVAGRAIAAADPAEGGAEPGGQLVAELKQQQIETGTHPHRSLPDLAQDVRDSRRRADAAAARAGARIAALATSPLPVRSTLSPSPRYLELDRRFAITSREQLTCGCHVHVGIEDDDEGVAVLDRIGSWLSVLLAMSGNSPFWQGEDTGYASFRSQVWNRWPTAGAVAPFGSAEAYHRTAQNLLDSGTILDVGMIYFDARLSARYPTIEVRVADVCLHPDDATLVAALVRGLVETAAREVTDGVPPVVRRTEELRAMTWQAGRCGLSADLVSPVSFRAVPAMEAVAELVTHVTPALTDAGDLGTARELLDGLVRRGTGADQQRDWYASTGELSAVVDRAVQETCG
jgi:carboxylate-amine ligase